jgi:hypothetical protein
VENEIDAVADAGTGFGIFDGAFDEVDALQVYEILPLACDEVIDATDGGSLGEQRASNVGSDEACNSGHQIGCHKENSSHVLRALSSGRY